MYMSKYLRREFYLLPRGEQRGMIFLALLLILSLAVRMMLLLLPEREPEGLGEFEREARLIMATLAEAESLQHTGNDRLVQENTFLSYPVNINRVDSVQLLPLPGIGPVFAGRIIKYRNLLGGFVSVDQLGEVYGMPLETLYNIRDKVLIDSSAVRKINIDSASFRELLRHPYLEFEDVKSLVNYREFKGCIPSLLEIEENFIWPDSVLNRIRPYLEFNYSEAVDLLQ